MSSYPNRKCPACGVRQATETHDYTREGHPFSFVCPCGFEVKDLPYRGHTMIRKQIIRAYEEQSKLTRDDLEKLLVEIFDSIDDLPVIPLSLGTYGVLSKAVRAIKKRRDG